MRFVRYGTAPLLVAFIGLAACSDDLAGPSVGGVTLSVTPVVAEPGQSVRVEVRNGSGRDLSYSPCFWQVEKLWEPGEWQIVQVWPTVCLDAGLTLKAGKRFSTDIPLGDHLQHMAGPDFRIGFTGFGLGHFLRGELPDTIVYSNRFQVVRSESE